MNSPISLDDDRIDAMRTSVMTAVDADVRSRGRRTRKILTGCVAAAAVVVVGGVGAALVRTDTSATSAGDSAASDSASSAEAPGVAADSNQAAPQERQVIRTGSATVVVSDPRREADRIVKRVEALGGRVDARSESGSGRSASAYLTVRVPTDRLTDAIDQLSRSGEVVSVTQQNDDVTATVVDLDARIKALRISIDRLEKILSEADQSADVVAAEDALTQRQSQLEELTGQRDAVGEDVDLARLDIDLVQDEQVDDVDPGGFFGGLTRGWNSLVGALNGVVEGAGAVLPWAGVALLGYGAFGLTRRLRQWRTARSTR